MSTDYQTYSHHQTYFPTNNGYPCAQSGMPQMVPLGSPMFQPLPMTGPVPQVYMPPVAQMNCGFQNMSLTGPVQQMPQMLPVLSTPGSMTSLGSLESLPSDLSAPSLGASMSLSDLAQPMMKVGSMESYPSMQRSPSPGMGMVPSYSPQPYPMLPPMISLIPAARPLPGLQVPSPPQMASGVTVTNWHDSISPIADASIPEPAADPNLLGFRGNSVPRSRSPTRSNSRARSMSDYSNTSEPQFERDFSAPAEPSKRELVNKAFAKLQALFGQNFDQNGNRGENILRLKVKTRTALEQIVPFIEFCQLENLIISVSCPISTKKGRQQVRGFLAYLQTRNARDADRLEELIQEYNANNGSPFNTWHRNPPSTWKNKA